MTRGTWVGRRCSCCCCCCYCVGLLLLWDDCRCKQEDLGWLSVVHAGQGSYSDASMDCFVPSHCKPLYNYGGGGASNREATLRTAQAYVRSVLESLCGPQARNVGCKVLPLPQADPAWHQAPTRRHGSEWHAHTKPHT